MDPNRPMDSDIAIRAGHALAEARYGGDPGSAARAVDPATVAALGMMALRLLMACLEARKAAGDPPPSGYLLRREAIAIRDASMWWPPDWPLIRVRRSLEASIARQSPDALARCSLDRHEALKLVLDVASRSGAGDLRELIEAAEFRVQPSGDAD